MGYADPEKAKAYWRDYHRRKQALKPPKVLRSRYRFINDGNGSGKLVHQAIVEKVLGFSLPFGVEIHHLDNDGHNNANSNLVVCPDHAYHALLHMRTKALDACGNASWMQCKCCKALDAPENLYRYIPKDQTSPRATHRLCNKEYKRAKKIERELQRKN